MGGGGDSTRSSVTALGNLAMACVANTERDRELRVDDPIAPKLLRWNDGWVAAARLNLLHPAIRLATERIMPGTYSFSLARMKHMDLTLRQETAAGIDSLVILGAGYDTRAYRMQRELAGVRVFEVDHPATSRDKQRRIAKALGSAPENVDFVEVDLARQDLLEQLAARGHRRSTRTLFLLSGVSMYLPERAMLKLLDQVAAHSSERTSLLFDYIDPRVLIEPDRYYGKEWVSRATKIGEEPRWGIRASEAGALLASRGLELVSNLDADELTARYLRRANGSTVARPFQFGAIAHAFPGRVPGCQRGD
jgi:methyltransferase (TIGR00027 family)